MTVSWYSLTMRLCGVVILFILGKMIYDIITIPFTPWVAFLLGIVEAFMGVFALKIVFRRRSTNGLKVDMTVAELRQRDEEVNEDGWNAGYTAALEDIANRVPILLDGETDPTETIYQEGFDDGVQEGYTRAADDAEEDVANTTPSDSDKGVPPQ